MQPLSMALCPACERVNLPSARSCSGCRSPLVTRCAACGTINVRSRSACHQCGGALAEPTAATLPPEALLPVLPLLDHGPGEEVADDWTLSLHDDPRPLLEEPPAPEPGDTEPQVWVADAPPPAAPPTAPPRPDTTQAKVNRRAAVRRAQLRRQHAAAPALDRPRDVLVLEPDAASRVLVCAVLEAFGFRPHVAVSAAEAEGLSMRQFHAAALLGLSDHDQQAAEFCRRLHNSPRLRPLALIAIGGQHRHADRVLMQLAGADTMLFRPVGRGDLARALEDCGLRLPADPRQGAAPHP